MYRFILICTSLLLLISQLGLYAQTRRVLFLGNSYTGVNNLPQLVKDVALSAGDTLIFDSHTPGGHSLEDHSFDPVSEAKILAGAWDYVVLQGQSQEPITQNTKFNQGSIALQGMIKQYNPCAVTMLYMTWGRKNGDASNCAAFPEMCTYAGMDSALRHAYLNLASGINAEVSPVSVVWRHLRQNNPGIELYQPDESHPSKAGSYAAACSFYTAIFKEDPTLITFDYGLSAADASAIRNAAKVRVFDSLALWDYKQLPVSAFRYAIGPGNNEVIFTPLNFGASQTYLWDFGDGATSTLPNPTHSYASNGTYTVTLTTANCDLQGIHNSISDTVIQFCNHTPTITTSNPWLCEYDTLWTQTADSYQWYSGGLPIPETQQYLPDYRQYSSQAFSVLTTVNGCSELSKPYGANPQWSGYYFDAALGGDPCKGDTALFIVLHFNGSLSGSEIIRWYKNGIPLPLANNKDTLFISGQGAYECKVIDPNSNCPLDTTTASVVFDCGSLDIEENKQNVFWNLYPNPASEVITLEFTNDIVREQVRIYNTTGSLVKVMVATSTTKIAVADLPRGIYYIRLRGNPEAAIRFMKQ